ncbi:MAG: DUF4249 domain-containing protein [Bacteroidota bacterium]
MRHLVLFAAVAVVVTGCELVVDVDVPTLPATLTVNSFPEAGASWEAHLAAAVPVVSTQQVQESVISDGTVEVFHNGARIAELAYTPADTDPNFLLSPPYRSQGPRVVAGETYTLRASAPGYSAVEATTTIPTPVALDTLRSRLTPSSDGFSQRLRADLTITDAPNADTYYFLAFRSISGGPTFNDFFELINAPFRTVSAFEDNSVNGLFFSDATFRNQTVEFSIEASVNIGSISEIVLYTVEEAYFRYHTALRDQQDTQENPFAEPAPVYSNVQNGLGIVASLAAAPAIVINPEPISFTEIAGTYQAQTFQYLDSADGTPIQVIINPTDFTMTLAVDGTITGELRLPPNRYADFLDGYDGTFTGQYTINSIRNTVDIDLAPFDVFDRTYVFERCGTGCKLLRLDERFDVFPRTTLFLIDAQF